MGILKKLRAMVSHRKEVKNSTQNAHNTKDGAGKLMVDGTMVDTNGVYEVVERTIYPEKIICPDCGGVTTEGLEFCDKCAGELHKMFQ